MNYSIKALGLGLGTLMLLFSCKETPKKEKIAPKDVEPAAVVVQTQKATAFPEGKKLFDQYCSICHQTDGSGVPRLNPPLQRTQYVLGDKEHLIGIVLQGSNEGLEVLGQTYANAMPAHDFLKDEQVAQVLSYVRSSFGNDADAVSAEEVAQVRQK